MKAEVIGRKTIKFINGIVNNSVLIIIVLLVAFAGYALWDTHQLHQAAGKSNYSVYKPTAENQGKSFKELQDVNAEVFAWLSVYGTNIDYPVTQGSNNMKYVNTSAEGLYSLSGSIFLDCRNSNDFSDFSNILYGHHMARRVMFGEISLFSDRNVFDSLKYGNLYFGEEDHGIEFFAFIHTDAYDSAVFTPYAQGAQSEQYLDRLLEKAVYTRDVCVAAGDRIVLLSTCSSDSTNGRDILVGKITDEVYDDLSIGTTTSNAIIRTNPDSPYSLVKELPVLALALALILVILAIVCILLIRHRRKRSKKH